MTQREGEFSKSFNAGGLQLLLHVKEMVVLCDLWRGNGAVSAPSA